MNREVMIVTGAGQISMAIARRIGYGKKIILDFEEVADDRKPIAEIPLNKRNAIISLTVFVVSVALFIIQPFKWDLGLIAVSGATIVIALDCVDGRTELRNMMWPAIITLGAALAIADGFVQSGAG